MKLGEYLFAAGRSARLGSLVRFFTTLCAATLLPSGFVYAGGVVTNYTETNLRAAMTGGGPVTFTCDGTITLSNTIIISTNTTLDATGHQITISGNNSVGVFGVNTDVSFTAMNLTIANGRSTAGAGIFNGGSVNLQNCVFTANTARGLTTSGDGADGSGGAIYNAGSLTASSCSFLKNSASGGMGYSWVGQGHPPQAYSGGDGGAGNGGAIWNVGVMMIDRGLFASNSAAGGLGGQGQGAWAGGPPDSTYGLIPGGGGGDGGNGRGAALYNGGSANLVNCTFAWNEGIGGAGGQGGAAASLWWEGHLFWAPAGPGGWGGWGVGGIYSSNAVLNLTNCTLAFNSAEENAGASGIYAGAPGGTNATCRLVNTLLAFNSVTNSSGKITDAGHNLSSDASCAFTNIGSLNNTDPKLGPLAGNGGLTLTMALLPGSPAIDAADNMSAPTTDQRGFARPVGIASDIGAFEYNAPFRIMQISLLPEGGINLLVGGGASGRSCCLLVCASLSDWSPIATNQIGTNGTVLFYDNSGESQRFYRAVSP